MAISVFGAFPNTITTAEASSKHTDRANEDGLIGGNETVNTTRNPSVTDAVKVDLSNTNRASSRTSRSTNRAISNLTSLTNVGLSVTNQLSQLVAQAKEIGNTINSGLVSTSQESALLQEITSISDEITSIESSAKFNDKTIIDAGTDVFSISLDASEQSSSSTIAVQIPNIKSIASSFSSADTTFQSGDTIGGLNVIASIEDTLKSNELQLNSSQNQIGVIVDTISQRAQITNESLDNKVLQSPKTPEQLASNIAQKLSGLTTSANLNPVNVKSLLS